MPLTLLPLPKVTLPAKLLPLPGSVAEVIVYGTPEVKLNPLHLLLEEAWDMHPGVVFILTVAVALAIVLVLGVVEKFTLGVLPEE